MRSIASDLDRLDGEAQRVRGTELMEAWSADMSTVVDELERLNQADPTGRFNARLDLTRLGVVGHSLGGATALAFCHEDARCKAGVDLDGAPLGPVVQDGLRQRFLFVLSDHRYEASAERRAAESDIRAIRDRSGDGASIVVVLRGGNHFFFSDDGALLKSPVLMRLLRSTGIVQMDGVEQLRIVSRLLVVFLEQTLSDGEHGVSRTIHCDPPTACVEWD